MHFRQALLTVDRKQYALTPDRPLFFDTFYVDFQSADTAGGVRYTLYIHPKQDITVDALELEFSLPLPADARILANGLQSWSETRMLDVRDGIRPLRRIARPYMGFYGDALMPDVPSAKGYVHSWTYTHIETGKEQHFAASLNEKTGFTLFVYDQPNGILRVRKDMAGLLLKHSFPTLDIWVASTKNADNQFFASWSRLLELPPPAAPHALGWTSWYRYFNNISADIILHNADALAQSGLPFEWCQIDDGWQKETGDWLSVKDTFPAGMEHIARQIREKGFRPGLWIAPFVVSARSKIFQQHPDWLQKDAQGKPLRAGWNPFWGGWYYALDPYHPQVREYLSGIFHVIIERWGFDLLKVDFLFAACLKTPTDKTRGQVMHEAMDFIRKHVGNRKLVASGVPLGSAFGLCDYCRVGGDVHLRWEHRLLAFLRHRERVSTLTALRSVIRRWQLTGLVFGNDPDVFILRDDHQHLTSVQQHTLLTINALFGETLFTSDDVGQYSDEQKSELEGALELWNTKVLAVQEPEPDLFKIEFSWLDSGQRETAWCNLTGKNKTVQLQRDLLELQPFETILIQERAGQS